MNNWQKLISAGPLIRLVGSASPLNLIMVDVIIKNIVHSIDELELGEVFTNV